MLEEVLQKSLNRFVFAETAGKHNVWGQQLHSVLPPSLTCLTVLHPMQQDRTVTHQLSLDHSLLQSAQICLPVPLLPAV